MFLSNKGAEVLRKTLANKGLIEERGFKELVPPFKEEIGGGARRRFANIWSRAEEL